MKLGAVLAIACSVGAGLTGCSGLHNGFDGASHTLDPQGPVSLKDRNYALTAVGSGATGQIYAFELAYKRAFDDQLAIINGGAMPLSSDAPASRSARRMAVEGIALTDSYCATFFLHAGENQKWLEVGKDVVTVLGTLASGVLAISSSANSDAAAAAALFTATAYNGVDLYTRNFLFGSDNINVVSGMVMKVLAGHKAAVLPDNDPSIWTFEGAVEVIVDHQALCTPAAIRDRVLSAISGGQFQAYTPAGQLLTPPPSQPPAGPTPVGSAPGAPASPTAPPATRHVEMKLINPALQ
ncbi:MAG: hypothetical protein PW843_26650 [Azospirillaceae bacterium]|nr:hypothetical protein [Azospirillaceae bacterium]